MTKIRSQQYKVRNPEARRLHEEQAFRLKVISDKRLPSVKKVSIKEATILMEEDDEDDE